jgi:hypothetical protein
MWFEKLTFGDLIDRAAARWGTREALCCEGRRWSFAALRDAVDGAAKALIAAGVAPGDHVCLWLGNRPEFVFLFFAVAKIGAVLVPINTRFRTRDMAYIAVQSDATTLIAADCAHRVAANGPVVGLRIREADHAQVVDDVPAGQDEHALVAKRRELLRQRVVERAGHMCVETQLDDRDVRVGVHRDQHAPGAVIEPALQIEARTVGREQLGSSARQPAIAGRRVCDIEERLRKAAEVDLHECVLSGATLGQSRGADVAREHVRIPVHAHRDLGAGVVRIEARARSRGRSRAARSPRSRCHARRRRSPASTRRWW